MTNEKKRAQQRAWIKANPDRMRAAHKRWYDKQTPEQRAATLERKRAYRAANPERFVKYKATQKAKDAMQPEVRRQRQRDRMGLPAPTRPCPAVCECCGLPPSKTTLHLDHDHTTGKFRGWLCRKCNMAIGKLGDTLAGLQRATAYLQRASEADPGPQLPLI